MLRCGSRVLRYNLILASGQCRTASALACGKRRKSLLLSLALGGEILRQISAVKIPAIRVLPIGPILSVLRVLLSGQIIVTPG